jgi:hypothetical protein
MRARHVERIKPVASLQEFFRESVSGAMSRQGVDADAHTAYYVVNLLTLFARSEALFEQTECGLTLKPMAALLAEAAASERADERNYALQRVGDISLFLAGFFGEGMSRRPVDVDYYVYMGGSAYSALSENVRGSLRGKVYSAVFAELAIKFQEFVDVLADVRSEAHNVDATDLLRLYEIWMRTGSKRAARELRRLGIEPDRQLDGDTRH